MRIEAERLIKQAERDLENARKNVGIGDRSVRVLEQVPIPFGAELLCYTPEEYARKVEEFGIVRTATREGIELLS